jgi:hypothetical protein
MSDEDKDPFEAERRRRAEALAKDEQGRAEALVAEAMKENPWEDPKALHKQILDAYGLTEEQLKALPEPDVQHDYLRVGQVGDAIGLDNGVFVKRIGDDRAYREARAKDISMEMHQMRQMEEEGDCQGECEVGNPCSCDFCEDCGEAPCECEALLETAEASDKLRDAVRKEEARQRKIAEQDAQREKLRKQAYIKQSNPVGPHAPGIGGWNPGQHKPETHEALRFEIEAERALFLGKPVPTDPALRDMHEDLRNLHAAYQRTGDKSLLIPIAELSAKYSAGAAEQEKGRWSQAIKDRIQDHEGKCRIFSQVDTCLLHSWPVADPWWAIKKAELLKQGGGNGEDPSREWRRQGILESKIEVHERDCMAVFMMGNCGAHLWPVGVVGWDAKSRELWKEVKG